MRLWSWARGLFKREHPAWAEIIANVVSADLNGGVQPEDQNYHKFLRVNGVFPLVSAAVKKISNAAVEVPLVVKNPDGSVNDTHPLNDLLARPNPSPNGGRTAFVKGSCQQLLLTGTLNWAVDNTMRDPRHLYILESSRTSPIPSRSNAFPYVGFSYDGGRRKTVIPADRVLRVIEPHPHDPFAGLSPLKELEPTLNEMWSQRRAIKSFFDNGLRIGGLLILKGTRYSGDQKERLRRKWESRHGGPGNAGKLAVISANDADYKEMQSSLKDSMAAENYGILRLEIFNVYQVPPGLFDSKDVNRSNMKEQRALLYTDAVFPLLQLICDGVNGTEMAAGVRLEIDKRAVAAVQPNAKEQMEAHTGYVKAGVMTVNEVRETLDMEPIEGGDELKKEQPAPMMAPGQPPAEDPPAAEGEESESENEDERQLTGAEGMRELIAASRRDWTTAVNGHNGRH